jgi:hypothetical protein
MLGHELGFFIAKSRFESRGRERERRQGRRRDTITRRVPLHGDDGGQRCLLENMLSQGALAPFSVCWEGLLLRRATIAVRCPLFAARGRVEELRARIGEQRPQQRHVGRDRRHSGIVCAVAFSGSDYTWQWLRSRVIAAQKANTGDAFSLGVGTAGTVIALSSANLYSAVQPGGSLYGRHAGNAVKATHRPTLRPSAQRRIR